MADRHRAKGTPMAAVRVADIAAAVHGTWRGEPERLVTGVAALSDAGPDDLSYYADSRFQKELSNTTAGVIVISPADASLVHDRALVVENPRSAFQHILALFVISRNDEIPTGGHPSASVSETATLDPTCSVGAHASVADGAAIGARTRIAAGARIGRNASIGVDCRIGENAVLLDGVEIGDRVTIGPGTVVGAPGFGFVENDGERTRMPHVGTVVIEDDVEVGANCTIDRAQLGATRIGRGTKIDALVHVGHGVDIGERVVITAQCGISGSVTIGDGVMMGGQSGIADHIDIAPGTLIAARAAVMKSIRQPGTTVAGSPARPITEQRRAEARLYHLDDLVKRIRRLENPASDTNDSP